MSADHDDSRDPRTALPRLDPVLPQEDHQLTREVLVEVGAARVIDKQADTAWLPERLDIAQPLPVTPEIPRG